VSCLRLVDAYDLLVFTRSMGKITFGFGKEANHSLEIRKPVFEFVRLQRRVRKVAFFTQALPTKSLG